MCARSTITDDAAPITREEFDWLASRVTRLEQQLGVLGGAVNVPLVMQRSAVHIPVVNARYVYPATATDFQNALDNTTGGDVIILQAGSTYQRAAGFSLPNRTSGTGYVTVRSSAIATMPPGVRILGVEADLGYMPFLQSTDANTAAVWTATGAHHFKFEGIAFKHGNATYRDRGLCEIGDIHETSAANQPHHIDHDRCYFFGDPTTGFKRGLIWHAAYVSCTNSYFKDIKEAGADSQGLWIHNGPGPFLVDNNYIEASGENLLTGGGKVYITNLIPSDITITRNLFSKPNRWRVGHADYEGTQWQIKNLLELKSGNRVLIRGNVLENNWAGDQQAEGFVINTVDQQGVDTSGGEQQTWITVTNVTFEYNVVKNCASPVSLSGRLGEQYNGCVVGHDYTVRHNLFFSYGVPADWIDPNNSTGSVGCNGIRVANTYNVTLAHNTWDWDGDYATVGGNSHGLSIDSGGIGAPSLPFAGIVIKDNLGQFQLYGFITTSGKIGDDAGHNAAALALSSPVIATNVLATNGDGHDYSGNYDSGWVHVWLSRSSFRALFRDRDARDYRLTAGHAYETAASDGTMIGCDVATLNTYVVDSYV